MQSIANPITIIPRLWQIIQHRSAGREHEIYQPRRFTPPSSEPDAKTRSLLKNYTPCPRISPNFGYHPVGLRNLLICFDGYLSLCLARSSIDQYTWLTDNSQKTTSEPTVSKEVRQRTNEAGE
jgi:hypothetical protein